MHDAMYHNPLVIQNVEKLKKNAIFVEPNTAEGKAKVAEPENVLSVVIQTLSKGPLSGRRVLVTAGSTVEYIDPIRVVTNLSTGRMGIALAQESKKMGAEVTLVCGQGAAEPQGSFSRLLRVRTGKDMLDVVTSELSSRSYDIAIMAAAVADFVPKKKSAKKSILEPANLT